jgi:hypothetical protein
MPCTLWSITGIYSEVQAAGYSLKNKGAAGGCYIISDTGEPEKFR